MRAAESQSALVPPGSGDPQGSVRGHILFLIFVNDLPEIVSGNVLLFADDDKLMSARTQYGELKERKMMGHLNNMKRCWSEGSKRKPRWFLPRITVCFCRVRLRCPSSEDASEIASND